jgi:hypothetical protein
MAVASLYDAPAHALVDDLHDLALADAETRLEHAVDLAAWRARPRTTSPPRLRLPA